MGTDVAVMTAVIAACVAIGVQETGTPLGLVFPTATTIGTMAAAAPAHLLAFMWAAVVVGAVIGDCIAVTVGRRAPSRVAATVRCRSPRLTAGIERHGAKVLLLTRFVPIARTVAPSALGCLGAASIRSVVPYSAIGAGLWSAVLVGLGKAATEALAAIGLSPSHMVACIVGCATAATLAAIGVRCWHRQHELRVAAVRR